MASNIDQWAYVEAEKDKANLAFEDEKQMARFELGVSVAVYKWEPLELAVQNGWGGPESAEKRDWVSAIVVDLFKNGKIVEVALIEETLLYAMMDEFETNVDDESALPIAALILDIYKQCQAEDYSTVEKLYLEWKEKQERVEVKRNIQIGNDPWNPDVSDSENDDEEEDQNDVEASVPSLVQDTDVDMDAENVEPVVDEDGFELVQKKGRKSRH
ncbi:LAME_0E08504g1_1 [Lachancea meyersii CBS 8951]|uniref:LAME_0E08504g1_1 n=1 Tax=Lachancea meyersii CBS 8951 TaxID=1266667 RepID=A0A1G4JJ46_9SACH|nr:LAME_0E08504g1_1 [Lachancea meyersii CBS 8951]